MSVLHDNEIVKYEVDLRGEMIILYTRNDKTNIKVTYSGVLVHFFENVLLGSIIFDIEKYDIDLFLKRNVELLERQKDYCWPIRYKTISDLMNYLIEEQYNYYEVSSSYGLCGWVLAKHIDILVS